MTHRKALLILMTAAFIAIGGDNLFGINLDQAFVAAQEKFCLEWRKERDEFFKHHSRSPLTPEEKKNFSHLNYYLYNPKYLFLGRIDRYIFNINNPKYYATFLTNKGINKRYLRYGKFHFKLDGTEYTIEIYKSLLSDSLFIPFKDKTNGKETYSGGRYVDAQILPEYEMVLDFNMAYFPSCAYNNKLICALPPRENMLDIAIPAGERDSQ
jgi:uncharacterized protein (DUF1684 family)